MADTVKVKYTGAYVRGGARTLWMSREDIVETLALLLRHREYSGSLKEMLAEARALNTELKKEGAQW